MREVKLQFLAEEMGWSCKLFHSCEKTNMQNVIRTILKSLLKKLPVSTKLLPVTYTNTTKDIYLHER